MIISIVGYPWSGKTTIMRGLSDKLHIPSISTGDLIRRMGTTQEDAQEFKEHDLSLRLNDYIIKKVGEFVGQNDNSILDGFPRSEEQCEYLQVGQKVMILWIWSNPVMLLERVKTEERRRLDDDVEIVKGRIDAANRIKETLVEQAFRRSWTFEQHSLDNERLSDIIESVARFSIGGGK